MRLILKLIDESRKYIFWFALTMGWGLMLLGFAGFALLTEGLTS